MGLTLSNFKGENFIFWKFNFFSFGWGPKNILLGLHFVNFGFAKGFLKKKKTEEFFFQKKFLISNKIKGGILLKKAKKGGGELGADWGVEFVKEALTENGGS